MSKFLLICIFSFIILGDIFAASREFSISIKGAKGDISFFKAQSELKTVRSKQFCKEIFFPTRSSNWSCLSYKDLTTKCRINFKCIKNSRVMNRKRIVRRLAKKLKTMPTSLENFDIHVHKNLAPNQKKEPLKHKVKKPQKKVIIKKKEKNKSQLSLEHKKNTLKQKRWKKKYKNIDNEDYNFLKSEDDSYLEDASYTKTQNTPTEKEVLQSRWIVKNDVETKSRKEYVRIEKNDHTIKETDRKTILKSFSLSYLIVNDSEENSLSTNSVSWTPHYWHNYNWGIRGQLGFNFLQTKLLNEETDTFLVADLSVLGIYHFRHIYLEAGFGIQKWYDEEGGSYAETLISLGYKFPHYVLRYIDRFFVTYAAVSNEVKNKEVRLGIGFSF